MKARAGLPVIMGLMFLAALAGCGNQGPAGAPAPTAQQLAGAGLGFGPGSGGVVAFGGQQRLRRQVGPSAVTWRWTGARWQPAEVAAAPPARSATLLAADPAIHSLLLFGGEAETTTMPSCAPPAEPGQPRPCTGTVSPVRVLSDTWAFTGRTWQQLALGGDVPQQGQLLADDPALHTVVLVGVSLAGTPMGEPGTWEWTGHRWSLLSGTSPGGTSPGGADSLGYDPISGRLIAYGGQQPTTTTGPGVGAAGSLGYTATWAFTGGRWGRTAPAGHPGADAGRARDEPGPPPATAHHHARPDLGLGRPQLAALSDPGRPRNP